MAASKSGSDLLTTTSKPARVAGFFMGNGGKYQLQHRDPAPQQGEFYLWNTGRNWRDFIAKPLPAEFAAFVSEHGIKFAGQLCALDLRYHVPAVDVPIPPRAAVGHPRHLV